MRDARGIRQFVIGTGGAPLYSPMSVRPNSEVIHAASFGVLKLTLSASSYRWEFLASDGHVADEGAAACA